MVRNFWHVYYALRRASTGTADWAEAQRFLADYTEALTQARKPVPVSIAELLPLHPADRVAH